VLGSHGDGPFLHGRSVNLHRAPALAADDLWGGPHASIGRHRQLERRRKAAIVRAKPGRSAAKGWAIPATPRTPAPVAEARPDNHRCKRCEGLRLEGLRQGRPVGYRSGRFDLRWPEEGWAGSLSPGELSELAAGLCLTRESAIAPVGRGLAAPHDSRVVRPKPVRRRRRHVGRFALFGPTASSPVEDFARVVRPNILAPFGAGPAKGAQERQVPVVRGVAEPGVENGPNGTAVRCFFRTLGGGPGSGPVRADVYCATLPRIALRGLRSGWTRITMKSGRPHIGNVR